MKTVDSAELWEEVGEQQKRILLLKSTSIPLPLGTRGKSRGSLIEQAAESVAENLMMLHRLARLAW